MKVTYKSIMAKVDEVIDAAEEDELIIERIELSPAEFKVLFSELLDAKLLDGMYTMTNYYASGMPLIYRDVLIDR